MGPLRVRLSPAPKPNNASKIKPEDDDISLKDVKKLLFVTAISISKAGKTDFALTDWDGTVIATGSVTVADKAPDPWLAFGLPDESRKVLATEDGVVHEINIALHKATSAIPVCNGHFPVLTESVDGKEITRNEPLPRWAFDKPDPRIKLQADLKTLRIESEMELDHGYPRLHWLWRVWINGKRYESKESEQIGTNKHPGNVRGKKLFMGWNLDPGQIGAKKGDRIAVQLLYCPDGWRRQASSDNLLRHEIDEIPKRVLPHLPILTNKAEFVCP